MNISIIYPCYNSQQMLSHALDVYRKYDARYLDVLEFLIVDDGSSPPLHVDGVGLNLKHLRIKQDIPWNQGGAKNLGTVQAAHDWLLYLDADRIVPPATLDHLFKSVTTGQYYLFAQTNHDGSWRGTKKPFGVLCVEREQMLRVKGFDERFCGAYGYEDQHLCKKLKVAGVQKIKLNDLYLVAYDTVMDGKTRALSRDLARNRGKFEQARQEQYSTEHSLWLAFDWELVRTWTR